MEVDGRVEGEVWYSKVEEEMEEDVEVEVYIGSVGLRCEKRLTLSDG